MREALNRIARHADRHDMGVMVIVDQVDEKTRAARLPEMYAHILGRAADHSEMRRIIEPPMHVDSSLSATIQFADWVAAVVGRAIDHQLVVDSRYGWVADSRFSSGIQGSFTYESKLHLWQRGIDDLNHFALFHREERVCMPRGSGLLRTRIDPAAAEKMQRMWASGSERPPAPRTPSQRRAE